MPGRRSSELSISRITSTVPDWLSTTGEMRLIRAGTFRPESAGGSSSACWPGCRSAKCFSGMCTGATIESKSTTR